MKVTFVKQIQHLDTSKACQEIKLKSLKKTFSEFRNNNFSKNMDAPKFFDLLKIADIFFSICLDVLHLTNEHRTHHCATS